MITNIGWYVFVIINRLFLSSILYSYRPVGRTVTRSSLVRERGLRFKSRAGQIGHSVANGSPPL